MAALPSIRLEGNKQRALALIPEGKQLLNQVLAFCQKADIPTFSMSRRISDDEYLYALVAGGRHIVHISAGVDVIDMVTEEPATSEGYDFPDFLSGIVFNGIIDTIETEAEDGSIVSYRALRRWAPTPNCARIQKISTGMQPSRRLAVTPHPTMPEWVDPNGRVELSQCVVPRASMWTGTMAKVVQIVLGIGRISTRKLIDPANPTHKTTFMAEVKSEGVQLRFDYKFVRSHGIYRGPDDVLWLVEISNTKGVIAMPLPIFPKSSTQAFKDRAISRGDTAMETALDELGCLPTGESFPTGEAYRRMVASGDILQLLPAQALTPFYNLSGYSSSCGWAFSERGSEAHNVGYGWPGSSVFQKGYWYQININIGPVKRKRKPGEPIASGSASLRKQSEGYLYSPPARRAAVPVKYFEPLINGLLSHIAKPTALTSESVKCDTVVFVGFSNGDLKTARYFRPKSTRDVSTSEDDRVGEDCLVDGSWSWTITTGSESLPAMPYTNDIDPRSILETHVSTGTLVSKTLGHNPPMFTDFLSAPHACMVWRDKWWEQTTVSEERGGESRSACLVIPGGTRESYFYFEGHWYNGGRKGSTTVEYVSIRDPNVYYGWRKFPRINPAPYPPNAGCDAENCGAKHEERRIICGNYEPSDCSDFADSGSWATTCQDVLSLCSARQPQRTGRSTSWNLGSDFRSTWNFVSTGVSGIASGPTTAAQHEYAMSRSPDPDTNEPQYIYAIYSTIGAPCAIYTKGFGGETVVTGYTAEDTKSTMPTFIGVNQP